MCTPQVFIAVQNCDSLRFVRFLFPLCLWLGQFFCSLTSCLHLVRTCQYDGDPVELRDPGDVPALREHRLLLRPMPDPTGKRTAIFILCVSFSPIFTLIALLHKQTLTFDLHQTLFCFSSLMLLVAMFF